MAQSNKPLVAHDEFMPGTTMNIPESNYEAPTKRSPLWGDYDPTQKPIDRPKLLWPVFGDLIDTARGRGYSDDEIISTLSAKDREALNFYRPDELAAHLGRTPMNMRRLKENNFAQRLSAYEQLYSGELARDAIEERMYAAELLRLPESLLLGDGELFKKLTAEIKFRESWVTDVANAPERYRITRANADIGWQRMLGGDTPELLEQLEANKKRALEIQSPLIRGGLQQGLSGATELIAQTGTTISHAAGSASAYALAAMGTAALAGQAGPQALLPEEVITVPGAGIIGASWGAMKTTLEEMFILEAGNTYNDLMDERDADGNPIDRGWAIAAAALTGAVNAGIELIPFTRFIEGFPGGKKLVSALNGEFLQQVMKIPSIRKVLIDVGNKYAGDVSTETMTEMAQEAAGGIITELAKLASGQDFGGMDFNEIAMRVLETGEHMLKSAPFAYLPGAATSTVSGARSVHAMNVQTRQMADALGVDVETAHAVNAAASEVIESGEALDVALGAVEAPQSVFIPESEAVAYEQRHPGFFEEIGVNIGENTVESEVMLTAAQYEQMADEDPDFAESIQNDVRQGPSERTVNEAVQSVRESIEYTAKINEDTPRAAQAREIRGEIESQLIASNRGIDAQQARDLADVAANYALVQSERIGISPRAFWQTETGAVDSAAKIDVSANSYGQSENPTGLPYNDRLYQDEQAWGESADQILSGTTSGNASVRVMTTPLVMKLAGAKILPVYMNARKLLKVVADHKLDADLLKQLPRALADPVAIFASATQKDSLVVVTELKDGKGAVVIAPFHLNVERGRRRLLINRLASVYGKEKDGKPNHRWFENQIKQGNLRYLNTKKASEDAVTGLQLPLETTTEGSINTIPTEADLVNERDTYDGYYQDAKARIRFEGPRAWIDLFEKADFSSFIHELGHKILQDFINYGNLETASEQFKADYLTVLKHLGITEDDFGDKKKMKAAQETWAKTFERYTSTGKAPSKELRGVFRRLKRWMTNLYRNVVARLGVDLPSDIQGVFDRVLAAPEAIDAEYKAQTTLKDLRTEKDTLARLIRLRESEIRAVKAGQYPDRGQIPELVQQIRQMQTKLNELNRKLKPKRIVASIEKMRNTKSVRYWQKKEMDELLASYDLNKGRKHSGDRALTGAITLNDMTVADLDDLYKKIEEIYQRGRREYEAWRAGKKAERDAWFGELFEKVQQRAFDKPLAVATAEDLQAQYDGVSGRARQGKDWHYATMLVPQRFFDWLDDGKAQYKGPFVQLFVDEWNRREDAKLTHIFRRRDEMQQELADLNLNMIDFAKRRKGMEAFGKKYTVDEVMDIMVGLLNEKKSAAIRYGNFRQARLEGATDLEIDGAIAAMIGKLTPEEKRAAMLVIADYDREFDRINVELVDAINEGMEREKFYTPIPRLETTNEQGQVITSDMARIIAEGDDQAGVYASISDGFRVSREDIKPDGQAPIRLGLFSNWHSQIAKQEHAAAFSSFAHDLVSVLAHRDPDDKQTTLAKAIRERFGNQAYDTLISNVNLMIRDDAAMGKSILDKAARFLSGNAAVVYLAWNLRTPILQVTALPRFIPFAGEKQLLSVTARFMADPFIFLGRAMQLLPPEMRTNLQLVEEADPQLRNRDGNVAIQKYRAERKRSNGVLRPYENFVGHGFDAIALLDRWVSAIGYTATYETNVKRGLTAEQAHREAQRAVLLTQQPASAKDTSMLWRESAIIKLQSMLFQSEAAQTWNMTTYDLVQGVRQKSWNGVKASLATLLALTITAILTEVARNGLPVSDDEYEEPPSAAEFAARAWTNQFIGSIPLIGSEAMVLWDRAARGKYGTSNFSAVVAPLAKAAEAAKYFIFTDADEKEYDDDYKRWRMAGYALEGLSLVSPVPIPYTTFKRAVQSTNLWLADDEPLAAALNMVGRRPRK